jgi:hypothetical protein
VKTILTVILSLFSSSSDDVIDMHTERRQMMVKHDTTGRW